MSKKMYLYVATTRDKYELPIAVADSSGELADMLGIPKKTVYMYMSKGNSANPKRTGFHKIFVGDMTETEYNEVFGEEK